MPMQLIRRRVLATPHSRVLGQYVTLTIVDNVIANAGTLPIATSEYDPRTRRLRLFGDDTHWIDVAGDGLPGGTELLEVAQ